MSHKRRALPNWMVGGDPERNGHGEKKKANTGKKVWSERETLYFMNEAELVDAALRILTEGGERNSGTGTRALQPEAGKDLQDRLAMTNSDSIKRKKNLVFESDTEAESSDCELSKKTCMSATDPEDLAEKETLAYAPPLEPGDQGMVERDSEEAAALPCGVDPKPDSGSVSPGASDEEALRLVREIFFT